MSKPNFNPAVENHVLQKSLEKEKNKNADLTKEKDTLKLKVEELQNVLKQNNDELDLSIEEVKLYQNVRAINVDDPSFIDLMNSIKEYGQLQPVLISNDNYLISGHRRLLALKMLKIPKISIKKLSEDISNLKDKLELLQYAENEVRQNLDNFEIGEIFNSYLDKGYTNKQIAELFNKDLSNVGILINLKNIDEKIKGFIKQFQIYAYSIRKYNQLKEKNLLDKDKFFKKNKNSFFGYKQLYKISKHLDLNTQKIVFLKLFENRLSQEELNSSFFKDLNSQIKAPVMPKSVATDLKRTIDSIRKRLQKTSKDFLDSSKGKEIQDLLSKLESKLEE